MQSNTPKALDHKFMTVKSESASNTFYYFNTDPIVKTHYYKSLFMFALRFNLALCSLLILFNLSKTETVKEVDETRYWPDLRSPHSLLQHSFYS